MVPEMDWAWIAGLFEGEGTCVYGEKKYTNKSGPIIYGQIIVRIGMSDEDVIHSLLDRTGVGTLGDYAPNRENRKHVYRWSVTGRDDVDMVLAGMWPHLFSRRKQQIEVAMRKYINSLRARDQSWTPTLLAESSEIAWG